MKVDFSRHKETHAWGRNGTFIPDRAYVSGHKQGYAFEIPTVWVEVESSRAGKSSPIKLRLTVSDARKLKHAITAAIKEAQ